MPARYHPLFDGLWNDDKFEGAPFEEIGFFAYLFGNPRQRPSGIYRITDEQIVVDTKLPARKVAAYVADLDTRLAIVRDGAWLFVVGYFGRQPKHDNLVGGVEADVSRCGSARILERWRNRYPTYARRSVDRRLSELLSQRSGNGRPTVEEPIHQQSRAEQSSTEQSSTEQSSTTVGNLEPKSDSTGWRRVADRVADKMRTERRHRPRKAKA
jgi:hypothetical protein